MRLDLLQLGRRSARGSFSKIKSYSMSQYSRTKKLLQEKWAIASSTNVYRTVLEFLSFAVEQGLTMLSISLFFCLLANYLKEKLRHFL